MIEQFERVSDANERLLRVAVTTTALKEKRFSDGSSVSGPVSFAGRLEVTHERIVTALYSIQAQTFLDAFAANGAGPWDSAALGQWFARRVPDDVRDRQTRGYWLTSKRRGLRGPQRLPYYPLRNLKLLVASTGEVGRRLEFEERVASRTLDHRFKDAVVTGLPLTVVDLLDLARILAIQRPASPTFRDT